MWTFDEALAVLNEMNPLLAKNGWGLGMTGSVLLSGKSENDLDIIVFPLNNAEIVRDRLYGVLLHSFGWTQQCDSVGTHQTWKRMGSSDRKHVEVWRTPSGQRVDLFILT